MPYAAAVLGPVNNFYWGKTAAPSGPTMPLVFVLASTAGTTATAGTAVTTVTSNPTLAAAGMTAGASGNSWTLSNTGSLSWTSNATIATILGVNTQDSAGTPIYLGYGGFSGSKSMNNGDTLTIVGGGWTAQAA